MKPSLILLFLPVIMQAPGVQSEPAIKRPASDVAKIFAAQRGAFVSAGRLSAVTDNRSKDLPWEAHFDFGEVDYLDEFAGSPPLGLTEGQFDQMLGLRHYFEFENKTSRPISVGRIITHCPCVQMFPVDSSGKINQAFTLKPRERIKLFVIVNFTKLAPGALNSRVEVLGLDLKTPIAVMTVEGKLQGGVRFAPDVVDFGNVEGEQQAVQKFKVFLDGRLQDLLPPGSPIRLVSSNEAVTFSPSIPTQSSKQFIVNGSDLLFQPQFDEYRVRLATKNQVVEYTASLSPRAPIGPVVGQISIEIPGFPNYMLTRTEILPFKGMKVGHLRANWPVSLDFGTIIPGKGATASVPMQILAPAKVSDLQITCTRKDVEVHVTPVAPTSEGAAANWVPVQLTATLSASAAVGPVSGEIKIFNPSNGESLRIPVIGLIKK